MAMSTEYLVDARHKHAAIAFPHFLWFARANIFQKIVKFVLIDLDVGQKDGIASLFVREGGGVGVPGTGGLEYLGQGG